MFETIKNAWRLPDLRRKILFTLFMLLIFRLGAFIPVPYIDRDALAKVINDLTMLGFFDVVAGGTFKNMSIFAMSVTPYINSSIIMQLLTIAIPALEELANKAKRAEKSLLNGPDMVQQSWHFYRRLVFILDSRMHKA